MGIKFASGGFLTTVQDMGRTGYQESGKWTAAGAA